MALDGTGETKDLGTAFQRYFTVEPALDERSREQVFRIRHQVYCEDLGWEPCRADGLERDAFDPNAVHCLMTRSDTAEPVGCLRLIRAEVNGSAIELPFERSCAHVLDRQLVDPSNLPRRTVGEVSRLAVARAFRQRRGEERRAAGLSDGDFEAHGPRQRFPFILVGLYLGATALARRLGVEHAFILTEPRLAGHFRQIGFDIQVVGGPIEHRGTRVPSLMRASRVVEGLRPQIRTLYDRVEADFARALGHGLDP